MNEYQILWNDILDQLSKNLSENTFLDTFGEVKHVMKSENGIISVLVPSIFIKKRINTLYLKEISSICSELTKEKVRFKFVTEEELNKEKPILFSTISKNNLNKNYTFDSFVPGSSNRLACLTAMKVAQSPGMVLNPYYIFGGVGLGKTHLMHSIGNFIEEKNLDLKILYIQATDYIEDYGKATRDNNLKSFEEKYENLDVLLVDDIQMLEKGKASQQEFFKLFNNMINNGKQIVITADCPPKNLNGIMERLTSRFHMGGIMDIQKPDLLLRIEILKRKLAENSEMKLEDDILIYIAENFTDNVRELEGALNRVLWVSDLYNTKPNLQTAIEALEILINSKKNTPNQNFENALSVIASMYGISLNDLLGNKRSAKYVLPRHLAMYILKNNFNLTYSKIGAILNGRDHTTIMNGCTKIENDLKNNPELKMAYETILKKV